jgi:protein-L-isoaspartate(D-aspartate) O-methyltransferase
MVAKDDAHQHHQTMMSKLRDKGIFHSSDVEAAFAATPRHLFLPDTSLDVVYSDRAIGLKSDSGGLLISSSSQPTMMAIMLAQLQLKSGDNVLEIGTATGYNAAIMAHLVGDDGRVTSVEIEGDLARQAQRNLQTAQVSGVTVVHGDGAQGYAPRASYDHILATVGIWDVPPAWLNQLKPRGTLVAPLILNGIQVSASFRAQPDGTYLSHDNRPCSFVYMRGQNATPNFRRQVGSTSLYILSDEVEKVDTAALYLLLSDDHEINHLDTRLDTHAFWYGFQLYMMLNEIPDYVFALFSVIEGQKAHGVEGNGIALFSRGSAALINYGERGIAHCFAGADAFLEVQRLLDEWNASGQPHQDRLRVRLIPSAHDKPAITTGRLFERRHHYIHVWMETDD